MYAGKTVFLLYLLLYRLERRLPTAVQFTRNNIFLFNDNGAFIRKADDYLELFGYWALVDSNYDIVVPSYSLLGSGARIIQASPPKPIRWKEWIKYAYGTVVVSELPHLLEIGAVL